MPPLEPDVAQERRARPKPGRLPGCDFFCLRFQVWYPSQDCAYRTRFQTYAGCGNCDQGRFNLKRHGEALHRRWSLPVVAPGQE